MRPYSRVYAAISLDAVESNMKAMRRHLPEATSIMGVVKTDGYGHGAVPVAMTIDPYVDGYGVASVDEGILLRHHGIRKMILVLGLTHESRFEELVHYDIRPSMFRYEEMRRLSDTAMKMGGKANVHLAVDTGMNRIGMKPDEASADMVAGLAGLGGICLEGIFTHFSRADERDKSSCESQYKAYMDFVEMLGDRDVSIPIRHCSNSAGILETIEANSLDMVRAGISLYGLYPSGEVERGVKLCPAMELKSMITCIRDIGPGDEVSYGGTFVARRPMRIATIPVGYGDGYPRSLSGKGIVLIRGRRARIVGRVCMDQFMVDVTDIPKACEEDEVTLIGRDGDAFISVEELAELGGGFHYEMICGIGKRVPRVYIRNNRVIGKKDYFNDRYKGFGYR